MVYSVKDWKKAKQKQEGTDTPEMVARRLINLFRQMSHLDEHSVETFNKMLLDADSDALTALNSIPGGNEIQEYRRFLQNKGVGHTSSDSNKEGEEGPKDLKESIAAIEAKALPPAEALSPLWSTWGGNMSSAAATDHVLTETKIQSLATDVASCASQALSSIEKETLDRFDEYQTKIIRLLSSLVVDSDVQKMQTNLSATIDKISQVQEQQKQDLQAKQRTNKAHMCDVIRQRAIALLHGQSASFEQGAEPIVIEEMKEDRKPSSDQVAQLLRQQQNEAPKFSVRPIREDE